MPPKRPVSMAFCLTKVEEHGGAIIDPPKSAAACQPMSEILADLYLGCWRDAQDMAALDKYGITHVLNCAKEVAASGSEDSGCSSLEHSEEPPLVGRSITRATIPMMDDHYEDIGVHLRKACDFIRAAQAKKGRVLVHCRRGISRSPAIVVAFLMRHNNLPYEDALQTVQTRRQCVSLNMAFREHLSAYTPGCGGLEREHSVSEVSTTAPTPSPGTDPRVTDGDSD